MKIYHLPQTIRTLIFDIDSTLYTCPAYAHEQVDCQVRHFAELRNMTADEARKMVADFRREWARTHDGQKISLGNLLTYFDIPIETSIEWRKKLMHPENFLHRDENLISELKILQQKYKMICVTNNPVLPARKTLDVIGISEFFPEIIGLDTCFVSKPNRKPFELAAEKTGAEISECVSIGDRYDIDLDLPLAMGMGGILVSGVEEVWELHKALGITS